MPRDESKSEQIWQIIQSRKLGCSAASDRRPPNALNGSGTDFDTHLVDVLHDVLKVDTDPAESAAARLRLQKAIASSTGPLAANPQPAPRRFWTAPGRRQTL